jgi:hypothetical protein
MPRPTLDLQFYDNLISQLSEILASDKTDLQEKKAQMLIVLTKAKQGRRKRNIELFFIHFSIATLCFLIKNSRVEIENQFGPMFGITFMTQLFASAMTKVQTKESMTQIMPLINQLAGALIGITLTTFSTKATIDEVFVFAYEVICNMYLCEINNKLDYMVDMLLCSLMQYETIVNQLITTMNKFMEEQKTQMSEAVKPVVEDKSTIKKTKDGHTIQ